MIYVFDTSSFVVLGHYYPSRFPTLWAGVDEAVQKGILMSTAEVLKELDMKTDLIAAWASRRVAAFPTPARPELEFVRRIFTVNHFKSIISAQAVLRGAPVADPFVIAAAHAKAGTVVTQERLKPNAARIPNVCQHFKVPYVDLEGFMAAMGWSF